MFITTAPYGAVFLWLPCAELDLLGLCNPGRMQDLSK